MKKVKTIDDMSIIKMYELGYISRGFFLEQILGCGERTIAEEGLDRFCFYLERSAERIHYDYFILSYKR